MTQLAHGSLGTSQSPAMSPGHHLLQGTVLVFLAEALLPLAGIITASFLTRRLGAADYGLLTISGTLVAWAEFGVPAAVAGHFLAIPRLGPMGAARNPKYPRVEALEPNLILKLSLRETGIKVRALLAHRSQFRPMRILRWILSGAIRREYFHAPC